jgi:hypothetical protein
MGYIKTIRSNKHFKKIFKFFLIIALLLILTIIMYSLFNKPSIENLDDEKPKDQDEKPKDEEENGIDKTKTRIECSLVTSQINKHRDHPFVVKNGDWDTLVNKYSGNPKISIRTVNIDNVSTVINTKAYVFVHSDYPIVIMSVFITDKRITNKQIDNFRLTLAVLKHSQLSYDNVEKIMEFINKYFL